MRKDLGDAFSGIFLLVWVMGLSRFRARLGENLVEGGGKGLWGMVCVENIGAMKATGLAGADVEDRGVEGGGFDDAGGGVSGEETAVAEEAEEEGAREVGEDFGFWI